MLHKIRVQKALWGKLGIFAVYSANNEFLFWINITPGKEYGGRIIKSLQGRELDPPAVYFPENFKLRELGLETILKRLYKSEINVQIDWIWDGGINVSIGTHPQSVENSTFHDFNELKVWLIETACKMYPGSTFAGTTLLNHVDVFA